MKNTVKHIIRRFYKTGLGLLLLLTVFWFSIGWFVAKGERPLANGKHPYVIVLGAGVKGEKPSLILSNRIEAAVRYGKQFPDTTFILSGGQGDGEAISEAEAMRRGMLQGGISEERLLLEDQSTSTTENLTFSKRLLPESENRVSIVTSDFHLYRARKEAEQMDLKTDAVPAETPLSGVLRYGMRERVAIVVKYFQ
ncbi:YdcF family protein [Exiguobacterium sp. Helios]|uniref:YdcF family protein n=1 Tax=unclassified Exiguobacterium TaxID=2644629 RepID=UPI00103A85B7|nr:MULTISPECIES: YdcF family protein [unclassified Exiguobacterium]QNR20588.1 YdcF family protein [Exiguobacterium sp. Helios]